ncbi:glycosyltransferase family 4 protein [Vibrio sp. WXL103]|uniref:glycosyltransferase family 4 protein n=1 Tax=Vibrio sp. WXL103 TaxID=3450710 RepID=UPI003EC757F9
MKLLVVTNMYPDDKDNKGIFVKEQVESLIKYHGLTVDVFNLDRTNRGFIGKYCFSVLPLFKKISAFNPDIIHVHYGLSFLPILILLPFLKMKRIKTVVTFHGSDVLGSSKFVKYISRLAFGLANRSIAVSSELSQALSVRKKSSSHKLSIIPCGVDTEFFNPKTRKINDSKRTIIFPSNPDRPEKNFDYFKDVFDTVAASNAVNYKVLDNLSRKEVKKLYDDSSIMLLTSDREGSPQVVKEAYASGLPVISRDVGDVADLSKFCNGVYVVNSKQEMVTKINEILNSRDSNEMFFNSMDEFSDIYSNENVSSKIVELYQEC